jgi:hypothetical protein
MAVTSALIRAYTNGSVSTVGYGVTGAPLPTNGTASLNVAFSEIGALSDAGVTESTSQDRTDIFIWQGNALVRKIPGEYTKEWKIAAAETSLLTLGINFPGSTITQTTEGASVVERPPTTDVRAWVLHGIDGTKAQRVVVPFGEITERGDVVWSAEDITVYEWTLSGYVDNGVVALRYYVDSLLATP